LKPLLYFDHRLNPHQSFNVVEEVALFDLVRISLPPLMWICPQIFMMLIFILNVCSEASNIECGGYVYVTRKLNFVSIMSYFLHNLIRVIFSNHKLALPS